MAYAPLVRALALRCGKRCSSGIAHLGPEPEFAPTHPSYCPGCRLYPRRAVEKHRPFRQIPLSRTPTQQCLKRKVPRQSETCLAKTKRIIAVLPQGSTGLQNKMGGTL